MKLVMQHAKSTSFAFEILLPDKLDWNIYAYKSLNSPQMSFELFTINMEVTCIFSNGCSSFL